MYINEKKIVDNDSLMYSMKDIIIDIHKLLIVIMLLIVHALLFKQTISNIDYFF
jgi:hypothetical protein